MSYVSHKPEDDLGLFQEEIQEAGASDEEAFEDSDDIEQFKVRQLGESWGPPHQFHGLPLILRPS